MKTVLTWAFAFFLLIAAASGFVAAMVWLEL